MFHVGLLFACKVLLGALLLAVSARMLTVPEFTDFAQFTLWFSLVSTTAAAGLQNGIIRQVAGTSLTSDEKARSVSAALSIWILISTLLIALSQPFSGAIADLLVGHQRSAWAVPVLTVLAIVAAVGQILCAVLTGEGRAARSASAQVTGLVLGSALAVHQLWHGFPERAAIGYGLGAQATVALAWLALRRPGSMRLRMAGANWADFRSMMGYSSIFVVSATAMPLILLALRPIYREAFGSDALGLWIAAQRISDVNTQLLGLYMVQVFLPAISASSDVSTRLRLASQAALMGGGLMLTSLFSFLVFAEFWVDLLLSPAYRAAIPMIQAFLLGDVLRTSLSVLLYSLLALGVRKTYIAIELAYVLLFAIVTLGMTHFSLQMAPGYAYVSALLVVTVGLLAWRVRVMLSLRVRGATA